MDRKEYGIGDGVTVDSEKQEGYLEGKWINISIKLLKYKFPNLPYYRGAADQVFFLGRPLGRFGLSSTGFFLGLPRFLGAGLGIGFERPRASSSSNT